MDIVDIAALRMHLETLAKTEIWSDWDDFNPMEASGGNFDDAYSGGFSAGETSLARHLLKHYF